jgi:meso-butanediol dehydrogenase/(S,S)-butanediol dehydrogenase/diacetyl reductase
VTGSAQGIGKAIALRLARDGFNVVINDIKQNQSGIDAVVKEVEAIGEGRKAHGIACDVSEYDAVKAMIEETVKTLGSLDVAVANAGIAAVKELRSQTEADLKRMFGVNINGVANVYIHAANAMIEAGTKGRIIGAASIVAYKYVKLIFIHCTRLTLKFQAICSAYSILGVRAQRMGLGRAALMMCLALNGLSEVLPR